MFFFFFYFVFFQAEDGIRDLVRSRGLGDVYKRQVAQALIRKRLVADKGNPFVFRDFAFGDFKHQIDAVVRPADDAGPVSYKHLTRPTSALV